ncbi:MULTISPECIES: LytTR family DNA-binding domain-containing protein [unclassified Lentimicrobium]|uniref:LytR/AlgR family response regulator transcription factor n=1 Tax=unclassified Lentimicrobium TaxID=2677434 RepID=UPI00155735AD|nr:MULTISPECIES: response regulator transcription factor [unclassified Lentimicrobium]NPD47361.1 response regulator transcription factor [Lentimicrobium sp. S6]NPD85457.1 response regulator transcription factor [Lentimicrobium sp. L6]
MKLNCVIIDDEYLAQNVLFSYIEKLNDLHLVARCNTALEAITTLNTHKVDLIFLDINMPEISGLDMLKMLENPPKVILTTAYSEFALESYNFGVVDYLLKPIPFERFVKAVNRVHALLSKGDELSSEKFDASIMLKQDGIFYKVLFEDILFMEANGNYIKVYTTSKEFLIREKLHLIEKQIPPSLVARSHKSYLVFLNRISKISGNKVFIQNYKIPIGAFYKLEFLKKIEHKY